MLTNFVPLHYIDNTGAKISLIRCSIVLSISIMMIDTIIWKQTRTVSLGRFVDPYQEKEKCAEGCERGTKNSRRVAVAMTRDRGLEKRDVNTYTCGCMVSQSWSRIVCFAELKLKTKRKIEFGENTLKV